MSQQNKFLALMVINGSLAFVVGIFTKSNITPIFSTNGIDTAAISVLALTPGLMCLPVVALTSNIAQKVFPSSKPAVKVKDHMHTPWSGTAVLFLIVSGLEIMVVGIFFSYTSTIIVGLGVALVGFTFNAPLMGEKARLDHIFEAADESAAEEHAATDSGER